MADTSRIRIRGLLGLSKDNYRDSQVSRLLVVSRLFPITALDPEPFWLRFWECYDCHYLLWRLGARHRDISPNNLMYNSDSEGILIDWDLATIADTSDASLKTERTGTMPFMPLGLLADNGRHGELKHLYRHDSESFAWVLLWTLARFENGKQILNPPFEGWSKGGYVKCRQAKKDVADLAVVAPKSCPPQIWDVVRDFAEYWMSFNLILSICPVCYEAIDQEVYSRVQEVREGKSSIRTGIDDGLRAAGMQ
ncbi:hypothetical protein BOTBODRAFT_105865 [Botryobasidium botryosum FD-172 SS1]|uniref:Protein kinase domain-containing protein n=1 Tax=Botryobasidium botryosum (strain FD-172 SS1) TaxID=930990 RepID=A0A067N078_BOTB1|nr:hypothetical protein BOTBODRAFT_105865 [Botryobasidium botryosum FD-172 SS1]